MLLLINYYFLYGLETHYRVGRCWVVLFLRFSEFFLLFSFTPSSPWLSKRSFEVEILSPRLQYSFCVQRSRWHFFVLFNGACSLIQRNTSTLWTDFLPSFLLLVVHHGLPPFWSLLINAPKRHTGSAKAANYLTLKRKVINLSDRQESACFSVPFQRRWMKLA